MTNEIGTTLQDIEAKAERKREAIKCAHKLWRWALVSDKNADSNLETVIKYIEEN